MFNITKHHQEEDRSDIKTFRKHSNHTYVTVYDNTLHSYYNNDTIAYVSLEFSEKQQK